MTIRQIANLLVTAQRVADEEWKKLSPERRRKICDNLTRRAGIKKSKKDYHGQK